MVALIIGGSTDIGISLAKYLTSKDYQVIVTYHNHKIDLDNITTMPCDVTNEKDIDNLISNIIKKYDRIDVVFNLAAISMDNLVIDKTKEEFMKVLEVNLAGTFLVNKVYSKYITDGLIVNISSTDGIDTYSKYNIDYSVSKSGVITLSKIIAMSTPNKVLCLAPNWINSETTRSMDKTYLTKELTRIGQTRLIEINELTEAIYKLITSSFNSGDTYRIDIRRNKLWTGKI